MHSSDSVSSDSEDDGILKKALDVCLPEDFNPDSVPLTGEEYLHHVIYERTNKCKKWVTATEDFSKFTKNQTVHIAKESGLPKALEKFYPDKTWSDECLQNFTELRNYVQNIEFHATNGLSFDEETFLRRVEESYPKLFEMMNYSQAAKVMMLHIVTNKCLNRFDPIIGLSRVLGIWIMSILALLEKPLTPDCCFKLREFAKKCIGIRASFTEDIDAEKAHPLNLFICIVSRHFDQLDLADFQ